MTPSGRSGDGVKQPGIYLTDTLGVKEMQGTITTRHLLINAPTIISEFGLGAYLRCIASVLRHGPKPVTFLECVARCDHPDESQHEENP